MNISESVYGSGQGKISTLPNLVGLNYYPLGSSLLGLVLCIFFDYKAAFVVTSKEAISGISRRQFLMATLYLFKQEGDLFY